jgi:hypothetical protein
VVKSKTDNPAHNRRRGKNEGQLAVAGNLDPERSVSRVGLARIVGTFKVAGFQPRIGIWLGDREAIYQAISVLGPPSLQSHDFLHLISTVICRAPIGVGAGLLWAAPLIYLVAICDSE